MSCVILVLMKNMVSSHLVLCRNLTITDETVFFILFLLIVQYVLYSYIFNSNFVKSFIAYLDERCYNKVQPSDWQVFVYPPMVKLIDRWIMARRGS